MLVLTRREGERVQIRCPDGTVVWVRLVLIEPGKARLGFEAPANVLITREELLRGEGEVPR
jgi:carbon storage regulator CsrA